METKSATIHRKMPMPARQLPITAIYHKAGNGRRPLPAATAIARSVRARRPERGSPEREAELLPVPGCRAGSTRRTLDRSNLRRPEDAESKPSFRKALQQSRRLGLQRVASDGPSKSFGLASVGVRADAVEFLGLPPACARVRRRARGRRGHPSHGVAGRRRAENIAPLARQRRRTRRIGREVEAFHQQADLRAQPFALEVSPELADRFLRRLGPKAVERGLLGRAVAREPRSRQRAVRSGGICWRRRRGAGAAKPKLSIRRKSCGRSCLAAQFGREMLSLLG